MKAGATGSMGPMPAGFWDHSAEWIRAWHRTDLPEGLRNAMVRNGFTIDDARLAPDQLLLSIRGVSPRGLTHIRRVAAGPGDLVIAALRFRLGRPGVVDVDGIRIELTDQEVAVLRALFGHRHTGP